MSDASASTVDVAEIGDVGDDARSMSDAREQDAPDALGGLRDTGAGEDAALRDVADRDASNRDANNRDVDGIDVDGRDVDSRDAGGVDVAQTDASTDAADGDVLGDVDGGIDAADASTDTNHDAEADVLGDAEVDAAPDTAFDTAPSDDASDATDDAGVANDDVGDANNDVGGANNDVGGATDADMSDTDHHVCGDGRCDEGEDALGCPSDCDGLTCASDDDCAEGFGCAYAHTDQGVLTSRCEPCTHVALDLFVDCDGDGNGDPTTGFASCVLDQHPNAEPGVCVVVGQGDDCDDADGCCGAVEAHEDCTPEDYAACAEWPSCAQAPTCGDGQCDAGERPTCPSDCPPLCNSERECGDGLGCRFTLEFTESGQCEPCEREPETIYLDCNFDGYADPLTDHTSCLETDHPHRVLYQRDCDLIVEPEPSVCGDGFCVAGEEGHCYADCPQWECHSDAGCPEGFGCDYPGSITAECIPCQHAPKTYYEDCDGDGNGDASKEYVSCVEPVDSALTGCFYSEQGFDCDDGDACCGDTNWPFGPCSSNAWHYACVADRGCVDMFIEACGNGICEWEYEEQHMCPEDCE